MTKRKSHEERREEIANTALILAAEKGVAKVTTQAIADRMEVSQGTVFRHFKDRDEVFLVAIELAQKRVFARLHPIIEDKSTMAGDRLVSLIRAHLAVIQDNRGIPALLFSDRLHQQDPVLKKHICTSMENYVGRVSGIIEQGIIDGSIATDVDAKALGEIIVNLIQGVVLRWSLFDYNYDLCTKSESIIGILKPALVKL